MGLIEWFCINKPDTKEAPSKTEGLLHAILAVEDPLRWVPVFATLPGVLTIIATDQEGQVVACGTVHDLLKTGTLELCTLYLLPHVQRKGLGTRMVKAIREHTKG